MTIIEAYAQSALTVSATELSVVNGSSGPGSNTTGMVYQLAVDPSNMAKGDEFKAVIYEKVRASGTQRVVTQHTFLGAQGTGTGFDELWVFPPYALVNGYDFTMVKIAGTDRAFDLSVRATGLVTTAYSQTALTVSTTELSVATGTSSMQADTNAAHYQLFVDGVANMAKNDVFEIKAKEKVKSAGTERTVQRWYLKGVQREVFVTPALMLMKGWDFTIKRIAGSDRAFDLSVRKVG